jgi:hypothetical protein
MASIIRERDWLGTGTLSHKLAIKKAPYKTIAYLNRSEAVCQVLTTLFTTGRGAAALIASRSTKVFQSFRRAFKRMTRDAELSEELHDALTGHAGNGGVGRTYGRGMSLKPLVRAIDKVRCPIDLGLYWKPAKKSSRADRAEQL